MSSAFKSKPIPDAGHDHDRAKRFNARAKIGQRGRKPFSVLVINSGSSSLRFTLFKADESLAPILAGKFDRIGLPDAGLSLTDLRANQRTVRRIDAPDHVACGALLAALLEQKAGDRAVSAIGHRVVHGGPRYREPQRVDEAMREELRRISSFAPNHLPSTLALLKDFAGKFPRVPQIACFDTAFHHPMPQVAKQLTIPRRYQAKGVYRYGFHGLSYAYLMEELARLGDPAATKGRVILAHLGHGASLAAVRDGRSIDTSMGFTPAAGLVMSTRAGDLDPGLLSFLSRTERMTPARFNYMVNHESGLLGVSETSADIRDLLRDEATDVRAAEALALFCYQTKKWIGAYAAALGGVDTLVFAGGIGENAPLIRERICAGLDFLGIKMHQGRNAKSAAMISTDAAPVAVRVIHTDEELMIARSVCRVLGRAMDL